MTWQETYKSKLVTVEEAAQQIESGDRCFIGGIDSTPRPLVDAITDRYESLENVHMYSSLTVYPLKFLTDPKYFNTFTYHTPFFGPGDRAVSKHVFIDLDVVSFCNFDRYILDRSPEGARINVLAITASEPDEDGYLYLGMQGGVCGGPLSEIVDKCILQVNKNQPKVAGEQHRIHINDVTCLYECDQPLLLLPDEEPSEVEKKIAAHILPLIPDGATLQLGIGGISNAVGYGLTERKNLGIHTEMFTDSMRVLYEEGAITGEMWASFAWGGQELVDFMKKGIAKYKPLWVLNDPQKIAQYDKFISINNCMLSDLTGQVCSEGIGFSTYSAIGGQLDYVRGACMSKGGKNFLCMPSTGKNKDGSLRSNVVTAFAPGQVVDVQRTDVMYVVTEYGVADLFNKSVTNRVNAMISIAHPDFREQLREEAIEARLLPRTSSGKKVASTAVNRG